MMLSDRPVPAVYLQGKPRELRADDDAKAAALE